MIVEIDLGGRRRAVDVRREGAGWVVTVDGRSVSATVAEIGGRWSLLLGPLEGRSDGGPAEAGLHDDSAEGGLHDDSAEAGLHDDSAEAGLHVESGFSRTGRSYEVSFDARGNGAYLVHVNGEAIPLAIVDPRARVGRRAHETDAGDDGPITVLAPMPGRIVKVLVKPGDAVAAREGVVVVEAMKMENELRAPRAGTVTEVRVSEGMSVEARTILVVIE